MKIFIDTADMSALKALEPTGMVDGVTTNPTHLSKAGGDPAAQVKQICAFFKDKPVSVEVTESSPDAVYKQAQAIAKLASNVVVKIPCHAQYYPIIKKLVADGVPLNITLVFSVLQGFMMCKLGVQYISPFVGRWDDIDVEGVTVLHELRQMIDTYDYSTQILAASLRHVRHMNDALLAGADCATVPPAVLNKAMAHVLTDQGMQKFDADWQALGVKIFP